MRSGYVTVRLPTAMADNPDPQPVPIPIRIVRDNPSPPPPPPPGDLDLDLSALGQPGSISSKPKSDAFYPAWDKFLALEPKRAKRINLSARKLEEEKESVDESSPPGEGLKIEENAATSWEQAAEECRAKVKAIVEECRRLNQKYRDAIFDLESNPFCLQSLHGKVPKAVDRIDAPPWIKRVEDIFDNPQFFIDGATAQDVHQGSGGDCWFLAALMAVSAKKELIEQLCVARDETAGVYGFVFYRDGEWIYEVIDDKLFLRVGDDDNLQVVRDWSKDNKEGMPIAHPDDEKLLSQLQRGGEALYFSHCKSSETWLPLIEKAYAKAHGDYYAIEGGYASEAIEDLTGGVGVVINPEDIMDKERFWREQLSQVNKKYLFGGGSKPASTKGFIGGHAYAVLRVFEEGDLKLLKMRNPWGEVEWEGDWADGSKLWTPEMMIKLEHTFGDDGVFWISYKDFLKHFPSINRLRLFDKEWQVAQQWTSVNVPWTVDYLDTKFQFTLDQKAPVVVVLSQPDDRYFYGLRGRFLYSLHFRVYKEGEGAGDEEGGRWIVRSMHNSGNETVFTRSVSAEIEGLEPGTYNVVFKVTAVRSQQPTAEESILKYAVDRKEKLLHVGRRYDYAQTKGNLRAREEANEKARSRSKRENKIDAYKRARKLNMKDRERIRARKRRVDEAMREKRKEFEGKRQERRQRDKNRREYARRSEYDEADGGSDEKSDVKQECGTPGSEDSPAKEIPEGEDDAGEKPEIIEKEDVEKTEPSGEHGNIGSSAEGTAKSTDDPSDEHKDETKPAEVEKEGTDEHDISKDLASLKLGSRQNTLDSSRTDPVSPLDRDEDDGNESPLEPPDELDDDDFEWDSEIDGPVDSSEEYDAFRQSSSRSGKNEIFEGDPWNAVCVLGLRVYSFKAATKVKVVKAEGCY